MSQYDKVQFIGHAINTGCKELTSGEYDYTGLDDAMADVKERVNLVKTVLNIAMNHSQVQHSNQKVLKVFVLPEFFFRGKVGAYLLGAPETVALAHELQQAVKDPKWGSWFFIFGTTLGMSCMLPVDIDRAIASEKKKAQEAKQPFNEAARRQELSKFTGYNFSLCQGGGFGDGTEAGPKAAHVVMKELKSGIDFVHDSVKDPKFWLRGRYGVLHEQIAHMAPANLTKSEVQVKGYGGECIFTHYGFKWGVEICLDHLEGRLAKSSPLPSDITLQVVPSCGASIDSDSVVVKDGYVFNCDGLNPDGTTPTKDHKAHTELRSFKGGKPQGKGVKAVATDILDINKTGSIPIDKLFASGPGELHIYDALPL